MERSPADRPPPDRRIVDYSDPALEPHLPIGRHRRSDTGTYVVAGILTGVLIVCACIFAGYLSHIVSIHDYHFAGQSTVAAVRSPHAE